MPELDSLLLGDNQLTEIDLSDLPELDTLNVSNNNLMQIPDLASIANTLEELYLSNNSISDISSIVNGFSFNKLDLRGNTLNDAAYCQHLAMIRAMMNERSCWGWNCKQLLYDPDPNPDRLDGDVNRDCRVDLRDFAVLGRYWSNALPETYRDLDGDTDAGLGDLSLMAENWLGRFEF